MVLAELRDLIVAESIIRGVRDYSTFIDNLINAELQRVTGKARYAELLEEEVYTQATDGAIPSMDLPDDFQLLNSFLYTPYAFSLVGWPTPFTLSLGLMSKWESSIHGIPKFYKRVGNVFRFYPYTEFYANDTLTLSYYKRPELVLDDDVFPVESLINPIQLFVVARMLRMRDSKQARLVYAEAVAALTDSRAEANGS